MAERSATNLLDTIDDWGQRTPDQVAHVSGDRRLTYAALRAQSDTLAAHVAERLQADASPIAAIGHKEPELLIAFLAAAKAGHPYIPIDSGLPPDRIRRIITIAKSALTLTPESIAAATRRSSPPPRRTFDASAPCYIAFTSGSTGVPKGVVINHGGLSHFVHWMLTEHRFSPGEVFLNQAAYSFDLSVMDTYPALVSGGTIFSITRDDVNDPKRLYQTLAASRVTNWVSTPSFAHMCLAERRFDARMLPQLRRFLFCGEVLAAEVAAQLLARFPTAIVWNSYGPTEATVATTSLRIDHDILARYPTLPIGRAMPGTRVVLLDEQNRPVPAGECGEIVIAGPNVGAGYIDQPEQTARVFFEWDGTRAYRTGDRGHVEDGLLFCDGRVDQQIKLHGHRIELGDVEHNLRNVAGVRDAVVLPILKNDRPASLAAFVILADRPPGSDFDVARVLRTRLAALVPSYMLPRKFIVLEAFPLTANGKTDRQQLAALLA